MSGIINAMPTVKRFIEILFTLTINLRSPGDLRRCFEKLGPTFIKLGQLLAARPDLIPKRYSDEFEKLLDRIPQTKYNSLIRLLEKEFGKVHTAKIISISENAVASASIAQVHVGTLANGSKIAILLQKTILNL